MTDVTHRILIGACGWRHQSWQANYYPDDLPEDWQLGFYGNEFPVVILPAAYWQQGEAMIIEAVAESAESLHVVYEAPVRITKEINMVELDTRLRDFVKRLPLQEHRAASLLIHANEFNFPFKDFFQQYDIDIDLVVAFDKESDAESLVTLLPLFKEYGVGICWYGDEGAEGLQTGRVALTIIDKQLDMRQLRQVIEGILANTSIKQEAILIFQGDPPSIELMRNAGVMLDLF